MGVADFGRGRDIEISSTTGILSKMTGTGGSVNSDRYPGWLDLPAGATRSYTFPTSGDNPLWKFLKLTSNTQHDFGAGTRLTSVGKFIINSTSQYAPIMTLQQGADKWFELGFNGGEPATGNNSNRLYMRIRQGEELETIDNLGDAVVAPDTVIPLAATLERVNLSSAVGQPINLPQTTLTKSLTLGEDDDVPTNLRVPFALRDNYQNILSGGVLELTERDVSLVSAENTISNIEFTLGVNNFRFRVGGTENPTFDASFTVGGTADNVVIPDFTITDGTRTYNVSIDSGGSLTSERRIVVTGRYELLSLFLKPTPESTRFTNQFVFRGIVTNETVYDFDETYTLANTNNQLAAPTTVRISGNVIGRTPDSYSIGKLRSVILFGAGYR